VNKPIQLIVGCYNLYSNSDDEYVVKLRKLKAENDSNDVEQKKDTDGNSSRSKSTFKLEQRHIYRKSSMKKWDRKRHNKSNEEQKESKDMEAAKELDALLRLGLHSNSPPSWFVEYMESVSILNSNIIKHIFSQDSL